jgi:hypothetical protein
MLSATVTSTFFSSRPGAPPRKRRWLRLALAVIVVLGAGIGGFRWWQSLQSELPVGIAYGNGRTEADEIDIETKFAGRIAEIMVDKGDTVKAGQVLARMDTRDLEASLGKGAGSAAPGTEKPGRGQGRFRAFIAGDRPNSGTKCPLRSSGGPRDHHPHRRP